MQKKPKPLGRSQSRRESKQRTSGKLIRSCWALHVSACDVVVASPSPPLVFSLRSLSPLSEVPTEGNTPVTSGESDSATGSTEHSREGVGVGCEAQEGREVEPGIATVAGGSTMLGGGRLWEVQGRLEALRKRHDQWTCFLCCHVRTGTIVIGFWHMLLHLMALSLIAVVVVHPEMLSQSVGPLSGLGGSGDQLTVNPHQQDVQAVKCGAEMPCILATQGDDNSNQGGFSQGNYNKGSPNQGNPNQASNDFSLSLGNLLTTHRLNTDEVNVALFITLCTFVVTLLLVYGAFRGQPSHLMPFFFLQVFDFCISSMTMIGYLSYLPNIRQRIRETPAFPFQQQLLAMNTKCLTFFVMLIFITTLMAKAYCISIVWRCYKFLMLKAQAGRSVLRYMGGVSGPVDQESQTLVMGQDLPDYDTAMADPQYRKKLSGMFPEPPPSYEMAMATLFAQQESGQDHLDSAEGACGGTQVNIPTSSQSLTSQDQPSTASAVNHTPATSRSTVPVSVVIMPSANVVTNTPAAD
ncbi:tetraspanning orphan receptor-like isoform X2 [Penaeus indicus]|uniref:tetraspanning orphan receptor-like isoform X2 n=1 Tax=Penaeus indicus TaxID=29960 RepID=UPI00300C6DD3